MPKRTIEQLMKPVIKADLLSLLSGSGYNLRMGNDIMHADASDTKKTIVCILRTGKGTRSDIDGVVAVGSTVSMAFRVNQNYVQDFLKVLNTYCEASMQFYGTVTDDMEDEPESPAVTYTYKLLWDTATSQGIPFEVSLKYEGPRIDLKNESNPMTFVYLTGYIRYADKLFFDDEELFFLIGGVYKKLYGTVSFEENLSPSVQVTPLVNSYKPKIDINGDSQSVGVTVTVIPGDPVHDWLIGLYFVSARTSSSFDATVEQKKRSLAVDQSGLSVVLSGFRRYVQNGYTYLTFTINRK